MLLCRVAYRTALRLCSKTHLLASTNRSGIKNVDPADIIKETPT